MIRPSVPVPSGLVDALDCALETGARMRPEHICGVLDWLHGVITMNTETHVAFSVDQMILIAHALGDAMGAPIHEINTEHVANLDRKPLPRGRPEVTAKPFKHPIISVEIICAKCGESFTTEAAAIGRYVQAEMVDGTHVTRFTIDDLDIQLPDGCTSPLLGQFVCGDCS